MFMFFNGSIPKVKRVEFFFNDHSELKEVMSQEVLYMVRFRGVNEGNKLGLGLM